MQTRNCSHVAGQLALLVLNARDFGVLHQLGVEPDQLHANTGNGGKLVQAYKPRLQVVHPTLERWSQPALWPSPIIEPWLAIMGLSVAATTAQLPA